MKKMHESVVTTYMNVTLLFVMLCVVFATGGNLMAWQQFGWLEWVCLVFMATSNVGSQVFKFRAVQRAPVSKLQPLTFTQAIFQFVADLLIFREEFSSVQYIGISIVFFVFMVSVGAVFMPE